MIIQITALSSQQQISVQPKPTSHYGGAFGAFLSGPILHSHLLAKQPFIHSAEVIQPTPTIQPGTSPLVFLASE